MAKLILVRNGQTKLEARGLREGGIDSDLTVQGRADAMEAGVRLSSLAIRAVYVSEQPQSLQTAKQILSQQEFILAEPVPTLALNDRYLGKLAGKSEEQLSGMLDERELDLALRGWDYQIEGGVTLKHIHDRRITPFHGHLSKLLAKGFDEPDAAAMVVAPEDPLRAYVRLLENMPERDVHQLEFGSADIRAYEIATGGRATHVNLPENLAASPITVRPESVPDTRL